MSRGAVSVAMEVGGEDSAQPSSSSSSSSKKTKDHDKKPKKEKKPLFESSAEVQKEIERLLVELEEKEDELTVEAETLYAWIKAQDAEF